MNTKEKALEIIERLLGKKAISVKEASILIQAINDGSSGAAPQVYPTNIPNTPYVPNTPQMPTYPGLPIVWCGNGGNTGQYTITPNTTIC